MNSVWFVLLLLATAEVCRGKPRRDLDRMQDRSRGHPLEQDQDRDMNMFNLFRPHLNERISPDEEYLKSIFDSAAEQGSYNDDNQTISATELQIIFTQGVTGSPFLTTDKAKACIAQYDVSGDTTWNFEEFKAGFNF